MRTNPHYTPEQLAEVRKVDLLTYLMATSPGSLVKHSPSEWRTVEHGSLAISNGKWNWFAGNVGGHNALDYLMKVENESFPSAVQKVIEVMNLPVQTYETVLRNATYEKEHKPFALPVKSETTKRVEAYLRSRGIDHNLIRECIRQGSIYESGDYHNVVFVGKDTAGTPKFASLRGTYPESRFRMDVEGSDKRCNFIYIPSGCNLDLASTVAIFEAPIDALSFATLNRKFNICPSVPWYDLPCLSCSGTAHAPVLHFLKQHPNIENVMICFDNDEAGNKGMLRVAQQIRADPTLRAQVKSLRSGLPPPDRGKDWNEVLTRTLPQPEPQYQTHRPPTRAAQKEVI